MFRRLAPLSIVLAIGITACGGAAAIDDPKEILTQSVQAMTEVESVHFVVAFDGTVSIPELGGEIGLAGTQLEGRMAMDGSAAVITFAVPMMFGLNGEMRMIGDTGYVRTSLTGPMWMAQPIEAGSDDPIGTVTDPQEVLAELEKTLDKEGIELTKLDDVECGNDTCYQVQVTVSGEAFLESEDAASAPPELLEALSGGMTFVLQIDRETLYMRLVTTSFSAEEVGTVDVTFTFDEWNEPVDVEAPPADEVTEGGAFPFP